jgi:hypothetical protein
LAPRWRTHRSRPLTGRKPQPTRFPRSATKFVELSAFQLFTLPLATQFGARKSSSEQPSPAKANPSPRGQASCHSIFHPLLFHENFAPST